MLTRICLSFALLFAMPVWSQVEPDATGPPPASEDQMQTPPPVSGEAYPTATGSEARSNFLRAGFTLNTAYNDNVLAGATAKPISDLTYTISPTIALDQTTSRQHRIFTYSPGFTTYQHTSALNNIDQNAVLHFQYRLSPHATISLDELFSQSSNVFNQPYGGVSGSTLSPTEAVVAPFAELINNVASAELSYQFSRNGMVGGSGTSTILNYPNPAQAVGLANSNSRGGSAFYNLRLSSMQYIGLTYQYSRMIASPVTGGSVTQTHTIYFFYTLYLKHALSLSVSGGPQHFNEVQSPFPASASWTPAVTASMGWQGSHTNFAASYSRTVTGAGGLLGAFETDNASASARWQMARTWTVGSAGTYATQKNVLPAIFPSSSGGRTVSGTISFQHPISERFTVKLGYTRLHQSYTGVAVVSENPDSDSENISISYQFARSLGR